MSESTCSPAVCQNPGPRGGPCKKCANARQLAKYYENRDARLAYMKQWRETNAEYNKQRIKKWFEDNADHRRAYLDATREEVNRKSRERRAANPGLGTENCRRWRAENPEKWALKNRENSRRRQSHTKASAVAYASVLERDGMVCHICSGDIPSLADLHFDHVIPLAKGGPHTADNIKPAHALCNLRKSDKII